MYPAQPSRKLEGSGWTPSSPLPPTLVNFCPFQQNGDPLNTRPPCSGLRAGLTPDLTHPGPGSPGPKVIARLFTGGCEPWVVASFLGLAPRVPVSCGALKRTEVHGRGHPCQPHRRAPNPGPHPQLRASLPADFPEGSASRVFPVLSAS